MFDNFDDAVKKIAESPEKVAMLREVIGSPGRLMQKTAGSEMGPLASVATKIIGTAGGAALVAGGSLLANKFLHNAPDTAQSRASETGKLQAQRTFKLEQTAALAPAHEQVFSMLQKDEVIKDADKSMVKSTYDTMKKFAPNLAADVNAAKSFLREHVLYGTGPSYASLKNLTEAEQAVAKAGGG